MANKIHASSEWLDECSRQLASVANAIQSAAGTLSGINLRRDEGGDLRTTVSVRLSISGQNFSGSNAADDIRQLHSAARSLSQSAGRMRDGARAAAQIFERVENAATSTITGIAGGLNADIYSDGGAGGGYGGGIAHGSADFTWGPDRIPAADWTPDRFSPFVVQPYVFRPVPFPWTLNPLAFVLLGPGGAYMGPGRISEKFLDFVFDEDNGWEWKGKSKPWKDKLDPDREWGLQEKDGKWGEKSDSNPLKKYQGPKVDKTWVEAGKEIKGEKNAFKYEGSIENESGSLSATIKAGTIAGSAGIYGGLYTMKYDNNGNPVKVFTPGVRAEAGASISVFEAEAKSSLKSQYVDGLSYEGSVGTKVGYASAKAGAEMGLIDGKVAMHAGASAEAIAAEVNGSVGVDYMGVKGTVKGTLNVGVGAHADVGYKDGKISCDVGASLGVGGSVSFELDVSGVVDAAGKAAGDVYKGVKAFRNGCRSALKLIF